MQSCSGGVYEDDRLDLTLATAQGAEAHVSTQAATVVHSMPSGSATQRVRIRCEGGSYLEYLPDPQILFPGSRFRSELAVRLGGDAVALVSDSFLSHDPAGRDDKFSAYFSEIVIENEAGKALAIDRLKVDGQAFRDSCPGISGRFQAQGTMIVAGLDLASRAVTGELHKIRLDRDVAASRLLAFAELCRHVSQGARCGRGGTEARSATGVVRGTAGVERLAPGRTQEIGGRLSSLGPNFLQAVVEDACVSVEAGKLGGHLAIEGRQRLRPQRIGERARIFRDHGPVPHGLSRDFDVELHAVSVRAVAEGLDRTDI